MRTVLFAEALCAFAAFYLLFGPPIYSDTSLRPLACIPFLFGMLLYIEYPPPGKGVGKEAAALPDMRPVPVSRADAQLPLGDGGSLLPGHGYVLIFYRNTAGCAKTLGRIEGLNKRARALAGSKVHVAIVSRDPFDELSRFARSCKDRLTTALVCDKEGGAFENYVRGRSSPPSPMRARAQALARARPPPSL